MASPAFDAGRPGEAAIEAMRLLERALHDSRAVDLEALCVLAGRKVPYRLLWHLLHAPRASIPSCWLEPLRRRLLLCASWERRTLSAHVGGLPMHRTSVQSGASCIQFSTIHAHWHEPANMRPVCGESANAADGA